MHWIGFAVVFIIASAYATLAAMWLRVVRLDRRRANTIDRRTKAFLLARVARHSLVASGLVVFAFTHLRVALVVALVGLVGGWTIETLVARSDRDPNPGTETPPADPL